MGYTDSWEPQNTDSAKKMWKNQFSFLAHYYISAADGEFLKLQPAYAWKIRKKPAWALWTPENLRKQILQKIGKKSIFVFGSLLHSSCRGRFSKFATRIRIIGPLKTRWALRTPENLRKQILQKNMKKNWFSFLALHNIAAVAVSYTHLTLPTILLV